MNAYVMKGMLLIALGAVLWGFSGMCSQFVQQQRMMSAEWVVAMHYGSSRLLPRKSLYF